MVFTPTQTDGSIPPIPMSSAVPDGTNTPLPVEGGPAKITGGNTLAPVAVYEYDGYNVTLGSSTDLNTANSVMGRLTKIRDLLLSVLSFNLVDSAGTNKASVSAGGAVKVDNSSQVQPVSASSLPLPTGAALEAGHISTIDTSTAASKTDLDTIVVNTNRLIAPSVNAGTTDATTQRVVESGAATGTKTVVAGNASSVLILAANVARKGAMIYNDSTAILYLDLSGGTASSISYSVQVPSQGFFELPGPNLYNGLITGIWATAVGNARITEFS